MRSEMAQARVPGVEAQMQIHLTTSRKYLVSFGDSGRYVVVGGLNGYACK
jgi:hypothetical protein